MRWLLVNGRQDAPYNSMPRACFSSADIAERSPAVLDSRLGAPLRRWTAEFTTIREHVVYHISRKGRAGGTRHD
jgi:hypothetical protein